MAAVINALARLQQRPLPAREASILLAHAPRRVSDHADVVALADVLANAHQGVPANEDEVWMISYMDIMTVLLTVFVLLLAVAKTTPDALAPAVHAGNAHKSVAKPVAPIAATPRKASVHASTAARPAVNAVDSRALTFGNRSLPCPSDCMSAGVSPRQRGLEWWDPLGIDLHKSISPMRNAGDGIRFATAANGSAAIAAVTAPVAAITAIATTATPAAVAGTRTSADHTAIEPAATRSALAATPKSAAALSTRDQLLAKLRASPLGQRIETTLDQDNVSLEISDNVLFDTGSATLQARGRAVLDELAALLMAQNYTVSVEGHSDNVAFHNAAFASNWELSATRATHVTRYLIAHGIAASRLRAIGYADTQPRADNRSAAGRARNRRVSLVLHLPLSSPSTAVHQ